MTERRSEIVPPALHGERVDRVVALVTGLPRSEAAALVAGGGVRVGERTVTIRSRRLAEGDRLEVVFAEPRPEPALQPDAGVELDVVHADDQVVVVDKAAGVVVHPGSGHRSGTLVQGLLALFPDMAGIAGAEAGRPGIVHRLDKGTSGLLVVARTTAASASLVGQLKRRAVERRYLALVWGRVAASEGLVDAPVGRDGRDRTRMAVTAGGRPARTGYRVVERGTDPPVTLLECRLETGRTHQVRVHLAGIDHPLVGDVRYVGRPLPGAARPFLHAHRLAFDHPADGRRLAFSSELPEDLRTVLSRAGLQQPAPEP